MLRGAGGAGGDVRGHGVGGCQLGGAHLPRGVSRRLRCPGEAQPAAQRRHEARGKGGTRTSPPGAPARCWEALGNRVTYSPPSVCCSPGVHMLGCQHMHVKGERRSRKIPPPGSPTTQAPGPGCAENGAPHFPSPCEPHAQLHPAPLHQAAVLRQVPPPPPPFTFPAGSLFRPPRRTGLPSRPATPPSRFPALRLLLEKHLDVPVR